MQKYTLSKDQVHDLVQENKYKINPKHKFLSRCIDGRYADSDNLPPLSLAGADAGELALIIATANAYGLEVDIDKVFKVLVEVVGGIKNFQMHSDRHGDPKIAASGCGHIKQIGLDPVAYGLTEEQVKKIKDILEEAKKNGAKETILVGDHNEGAALIVTGPYTVSTRYSLQDEKAHEVEVFVHQGTLIDERHRELAKKLLENKAVKLLDGLDHEYFYQVLGEMTENHLMETAKRLAHGLPLYSIAFAADGTFKIEEMGLIE